MKKVILIFGLQGSGKTTLATELGKVLKGVVLTTEVIRSELFQSESLANSSDFTELELKITYRTVELLLTKIIDYCSLVIIDGVYRYWHQRNNILKICERNKIELIIYHLTCSEVIAQMRLEERKRKNVSHLGDYNAYRKVKETFEYPKDGEMTIDTSNLSIDCILERVIDDFKKR